MRSLFLVVFIFVFQNIFSQTTSKLILYDDFDNNKNQWLNHNDKSLTKIQGGYLIISSTPIDAIRWFGTQIFIDYRRNFVIETKLKKISGDKKQGFGLMWGSKDVKNAYFFMISSSGYFSIYMYKKGKYKNLKKWTRSSAIKKDDFNVLKIEKRGNTYSFYINGKNVYTTKFFKFFGQIHGFVLQNNITVKVDYLKITTDNRRIDIAKTKYLGQQKKNLGPNVNSPYSDLAPIISPDGNTLYFIRVGDPHNYDLWDGADIWISEKQPDGTWGKAKHLGKPLNNSGVNAVFAVTPDGNALLLEGLYNPDGSFKSEQGISISYKTKTGWSVPKPIKIKNFYNKNIFETYTISNDLSVIIMAIERDDSYGDTDLYISFRNSDGTYSEPRNLGPVINTKGSESTPFLASDGKTLYFCSDGHPGYGSCDIFVTKRLDDTWLNWSKPKNLGPDVNTSDWDSYFSLSAKGDTAFLVSVKNSYGFEDIFTIELPKDVRPEPVVLVYGKVIDQKTNKPIAAKIYYEDLKTGKQIGIAQSDPNTGEYKITLPYGKNYGVRAEAKGYIAVNQNLNLNNVALKKYKKYKQDLYLVPAKVGEIIVLNNIFFAVASAQLLPESYAELDRLVTILKSNPNMKIEIRGHTDNRGNPDLLMELSRKRALAVKNYLVKKGISPDRLTIKAFGGTKPIAKDDSEAEHAKNRRVEFKILQM